VKGLKKFGFEKIIHLLQEKCSSTQLFVNLNHVLYHLNYFRSLIDTKTKIMGVVKASAYGSGKYEIPHFLQYHNLVDYLAVAFIDEGVILRQEGITLPIMVINPNSEGFEKIVQYNLDIEIYNFKILKELSTFLQYKNSPNFIKIHIKLETGFNRIGFEEPTLPKLCNALSSSSTIQVIGIISHLVGPGEPEHDNYTHLQYKKFIKMANYIEKTLDIRTLKHLLSSSAILRFPTYQLNMVRMGIGIYGFGELTQKHLQPISTLKTIISQIKILPQGETVGYSRKGVVKKGDMRVATLPIGYVDGYPRILSNGNGHVSIHGHLAPVVGIICMDMCMVDVTNIPNVEEGDEVIIFGKELPIEKLAETLETVPYEILTKISERVKRVYVRSYE